ncbi:hypothetical protein [Nannocystis pusilla]|uniref:hypothetical protein n=1 Tax=Nannocystis pusilla TaxID=889268 RepID=UPI003BF2E79C
MPLAFKDRKHYYNRCQPDESLAPDDARNIDFDALPQEVRGASWAGALAAEIELSNTPVCLLVAGLPGSGKSTELRRLARRLASDESAGLLPIHLDAERLLDLTSRIDVADVVAAILHDAELAVLAAEGKDVAAMPADGYLQRFWRWLTTTDVELGKGNFTVAPGVSLAVELKTRPSLRQRVRSVVSNHLSQFLADARAELGRLDERAAAAGHGGLLVIFDSLEKLRGTTSAWYDVLDSAEIFFRTNVPNLELPVHVIFTVPTALLTRITRIRVLPMVKLHARDGSPHSPGIAAARELVTRRVPLEVLGEVLGPDAEARLRQMILWSGGYPRELVRLLQSAIRDASAGPLSDEQFQRLFSQLVSTFRVLVTRDVIPWLAQVAAQRFMTVENEQHRLDADRMLQNNAILYYANGEQWHDLHPAVYENPDVRAALAALREARAAAT